MVDPMSVGPSTPMPAGPSTPMPAEPTPPPGADAPDDRPVGPPPGLWDRMRADPQYAPEHLALEAVERLGPQARQWADQMRAQFPAMPPDVLAQVAQRRFVRLARLSGAVSGATGLPGALVDMGVLAWTQARLVLHIAAAYGVDPVHPDRAVDLLVLQKVHKVVQSARVALGVARGHERMGSLLRGSGSPLHRVLMRLTVKLAQMAGMRAARRVFAKIVPGAAIILGTWANSSATTDLARRTITLYRGHSAGFAGKPAPEHPGQPGQFPQPGHSVPGQGAPGYGPPTGPK